MDISEIKKADWLPKEHRLTYDSGNFAKGEFYSSLIIGIFFACLTPLGFLFGAKTGDMTTGIASLILAIILILLALGSKREKNFKTVLNQDGICFYQHDKIVRFIGYEEITFIKLSTEMPDEHKAYYSYHILEPALRLKQKTLDLYGSKNELLLRLTLEPVNELVIVLLMLIKHNPNLENSLSIADEKDVEAYVKDRIKQYEKFEKNKDKTKK